VFHLNQSLNISYNKSDIMQAPLSPKQLEFILNSKAKWNLAHGSVRSGKTVGTVFRFLQAANDCPDSKIYIVGHTFDTAYRNVIRLIMESAELSIFKPFCTWSGKKLHFRDKIITVLGAKDEGAIGNFQGDTHSLTYCDEMTLYPDSIIDMIDTRLSKPHSMGFAAMNPSHPNHKIKKWIDKAESNDPNYYSLHFTLDDNPYVDEVYKQRIRDSLSGLFYKRNYLGLWCLAEGAIFDFFDYNIHVLPRPPTAGEYWIAGIDYGAVNPFACVLVGVSTGRYTQSGKRMWVEKEYYWDPKKMSRQKTNSEFADDIQAFLEPYDVKSLYIDPSAASFKVELRKRGIHVVDANNDVENGIHMMTSEMKKGNLYVCSECKNTIREIEGYVWDNKAAERGYDEPVKKDDHAVDALRYVIASHKVSIYDPYAHAKQQEDFLRNKYQVSRGF
jgi:PBSX family phage terminase large subunit